jgi:hypothetical protein
MCFPRNSNSHFSEEVAQKVSWTAGHATENIGIPKQYLAKVGPKPVNKFNAIHIDSVRGRSDGLFDHFSVTCLKERLRQE